MDDVRIKKNDHLGTPYLLIVLLHHIPMLLCSPAVVLVILLIHSWFYI